MQIYGKNVCKEKLKAKDRINKIYLSTNFKDKEILNLIHNKKTKIQYLPIKTMDKMIEGLHQGIIMEVDDVITYPLEIIDTIKEENPLIVMLDHLEDPHNFGAIIRTCEALGVSAIIIPNDRSVNINATVVKTSAGAINNIKIIRVPNLSVAINKLKSKNYWIVGTTMDGSDYTTIDYNMKTCLIIGNEGKGMSDTIKKNCDYIVTIPMIGKINSLNASVSCAILVAHIQNNKKN